jgi:RNA polymerase sigma factor (sigma-70 family)
MGDSELREAWRYAFRAALRTQRRHDPQEAEDAAQESMLRLFEGRADGKKTAAPSWFATVAHNYVLSRGRHRKVKLRKDRVYVGSQTELPAHLELEREEAHKALAAYLLAGLPTPYRQVVEIAWVEGKTYKAVSEKLGIPQGTVMSRLFRARQIMKSQLMGA